MYLMNSSHYFLIMAVFATSFHSTIGNFEPFARVWKEQKIDTILSPEWSASSLEKRFQKIIRTQNKRLPNLLFETITGEYNILEIEGISAKCEEDYEDWRAQLASQEPNEWALEMADAWGKFPEGLFSGHFTVPGDFDECLRVRPNMSRSGETLNFKGRYCYTALPVEGIPFEFGTCYPSSCSKEEITILQNTVLSELNLTLTSYQNGCYTDDAPVLTTGDISMISVLAVLFALCIVGTLADLMLTKDGSTSASRKRLPIQYLLAFSIYTNTQKWLSTKSGGDNLGCIHGLRFLSTTWVVLCHTWFMMMFQPTWNLFEVLNLQKDRWVIFPILNGTVSVDTFFAMSGLLFAYNLLRTLDKSNGKLNVPMLYLHRYLRLTPTYALLVGIMATWFVYLGDGPKWFSMELEKELCQKYWWHNLLYINDLWNYYEVLGDGMCHRESWYLANDMHFFIVSPLLIYPLWRWKKIGMASMIVATIASVVVPFIIHYENPEVVPTLLPLAGPNLGLLMQKSYTKPWMRISPYLVGLWGGYTLHHFVSTKKRLILPKYVVFAGWCISTGTALAIIFGIMPWFDMNPEIPRLSSAFYASFHRFAWGVVTCWIIIACTQGYGGFINTFLSWKVFVPLGRLSFCVFLISYQLQFLFHTRVRQAVSYDVYTTTNLFFSHMVMSLLVGFICCITMESPFIALEKLIFERGRKPSEKTANPSTMHQKERVNEAEA